MNLKGLRQFLKEDFSCNWKGFAVWDASNGTVDCHYEARIILAPTERISEDKELARELTMAMDMMTDTSRSSGITGINLGL